MSNETPFGLSKYIELSKSKNLPRMMSVQNPYNLVNRTYEVGMSEISLREKCGLLVYYPLAAGGLSGKYRNGQMPKNSRMDLFFKGWGRHLNPLAMKAYDEYYKLAKDNSMTMVQLAQSFVNSRPFVTSNIIGATTMEQLKENIDSINIELTDEIMEKINLIHNNNPNPSP
jgi:aryl-alcohol dehydrogenase-like predicted oxidoreductase